jgi:predicted RNA-binding protein with PIN domain
MKANQTKLKLKNLLRNVDSGKCSPQSIYSFTHIIDKSG